MLSNDICHQTVQMKVKKRKFIQLSSNNLYCTKCASVQYTENIFRKEVNERTVSLSVSGRWCGANEQTSSEACQHERKCIQLCKPAEQRSVNHKYCGAMPCKHS